MQSGFPLSSFPVTSILMALILVVSVFGLVNRSFFSATILHPFSIYRKKEYYRHFTSDFVHVDLVHLALNEFMLYIFCSGLEETLRKSSGSWKFAVIYLSAMLTGSIISTVRHKAQFKYSSAGASGSIMGCMFSFMVLRPSYIAFYLPMIGGVKNIYAGLLYILILIVYQRKSKK